MTDIDLSANTALYNLDLRYNNFGFSTLPEPRATFGEYYYDQNPLPVNKSYAEGTELNFTATMLRAGTTTDAVLYTVSEDAPGDPTILGDEYFTWDNGKITLHKATADSVFVAFANSMFPDAVLTTSRFMVKTAEEFGKPSQALAFRASTSVTDLEFSVGIGGATPENPVKFYVDFGKGELTEFTATTATIPAEANVSGARQGQIKVYIPEGRELTAFAMTGVPVTTSDFSAARSLAYLTLTDCNVTAVDLKWNRSLQQLDLSGNRMSKLDLSGANDLYGKNVLTHINASVNRLTSITLNDAAAIISLDLHSNSLTELPLDRASNLTELNVADNQFTTLSFTDCESLRSLNIAGNMFTEVNLVGSPEFAELHVERNAMFFSKLPSTDAYAVYSYAPQDPLLLPAKAPVADLTELNFPPKTLQRFINGSRKTAHPWEPTM